MLNIFFLYETLKVYNGSFYRHDLDNLSLEISELSYEQSLDKLDLLLDEIKNESLLVEDLKTSFLKASLYLHHCENLLKKLEQEVIEINWDDL